MHPQILSSQCECKAGNGHCSHSIGLLYLLCHYNKMGLKAVPPVTSKTSLPQIWHIPQRKEGLSHKTVHSLEISKVNPKKEPPKKKTKVTEGVLPKIYCPVQQPIPCQEFTTSLLQQLNNINSDAQILQSIPAPDHVQSDCQILQNISATSPDHVQSNFGPVPKGSALSYQQKPQTAISDIVNHSDITLPEFPLPYLESHYYSVLNKADFDLYAGLNVDHSIAQEVESQTREQSNTQSWHDARRHRITSSVFKDICSRKADFDKLAERLIKKKGIQTAAMKFGLEQEPVAANLYAEITGNNLYLCGFVINPSCPHLGASPDRRVYEPNHDPQFGLLEIKCPDKHSFDECNYLKKNQNGTYKLKHSHQYFYQVMGQLGITGLKWCDFFVKCRENYHTERIFFDADKWTEMKLSIDQFYFEHFLPCIRRDIV